MRPGQGVRIGRVPERPTSPTQALPLLPLTEVPALLSAAARAWLADRAPTLGAALAYYTLFSMAPVLLIAIAVAGAVFGADTARTEILGQLQSLLGTEGAAAVAALLDNTQRSGQSGWAMAIGVLLLVVGATTVFAELQDSLDHIWRVDTQRSGGTLWQLLRTRLLSFGLVLGVGFLLMVSLAASAALAAWARWWAPLFGQSADLLMLVNLALNFALTAVLFAAIYKWMPKARIGWRDVVLGSVLTAALFTAGKAAIGWVITQSGVAASFGAASAIVGMMVWIYAAAQVFLYGAELTWLLSQRRARHEAASGGSPTAT